MKQCFLKILYPAAAIIAKAEINEAKTVSNVGTHPKVEIKLDITSTIVIR